MLKLKLWLPDVKNWLIWKNPDAGKDWKAGEGVDRGWWKRCFSSIVFAIPSKPPPQEKYIKGKLFNYYLFFEVASQV